MTAADAFAQLRALGYELDPYVDDDDVLVTVTVRGFGIATMFAGDDLAAQLAALADADAHAERRFQFTQPDAHDARAALERAGWTVERIDASADSFTLTPPAPAANVPIGGNVPPTVVTPDELLAFAASIAAPVTP